MGLHARPNIPNERRTSTLQTPGSDAARHADRPGLRGRGRHGMALTISDLSMAQANATGLLRPHALVLDGGCPRQAGQGAAGVAKTGMALTPLPESLLDGSVAQQIVLLGMF